MARAVLGLSLLLALGGCAGRPGGRSDASGDQACRATQCVCLCGGSSTSEQFAPAPKVE